MGNRYFSIIVVKRILLSLLLVFAPIKATLITAGVLVALDFVLGILAARKAGTPITSYRMRDTVGKLIAYEAAILISYLAEHYLAPEVPFTNIANGYVALTEGTSCLENLNTITGQNVLSALIAKINAFKS